MSRDKIPQELRCLNFKGIANRKVLGGNFCFFAVKYLTAKKQRAQRKKYALFLVLILFAYLINQHYLLRFITLVIRCLLTIGN
jgi:hypothetical protein